MKKVIKLESVIDEKGLFSTANEFDYHHNNIRNMADRGAVVINGKIFVPAQRRKRKGDK